MAAPKGTEIKRFKPPSARPEEGKFRETSMISARFKKGKLRDNAMIHAPVAPAPSKSPSNGMTQAQREAHMQNLVEHEQAVKFMEFIAYMKTCKERSNVIAHDANDATLKARRAFLAMKMQQEQSETMRKKFAEKMASSGVLEQLQAPTSPLLEGPEQQRLIDEGGRDGDKIKESAGLEGVVKKSKKHRKKKKKERPTPPPRKNPRTALEIERRKKRREQKKNKKLKTKMLNVVFGEERGAGF